MLKLQQYHPKMGEIASQTQAIVGTQMIIRVDGQGFSRLTRRAGCQRPHDPLFHQAMVDTARALIDTLQAKSAYTQSDEISVLLGDSSSIYRNRLEKLTATAASAATLAFERSEAWQAIRQRSGRPELGGTFDARVWSGVAAHTESYLRWRLYDARRNALIGQALQCLASQGLSPQQAQAQLSGQKQPQMHDLLHRHGIQFDGLPAQERHGTVLSWQSKTHEGYDPITKQRVQTTRRHLAAFTGSTTELSATLLQSVGMTPQPRH